MYKKCVTIMRDLAKTDESFKFKTSRLLTDRRPKIQDLGFTDLSPVKFQNQLLTLWTVFRKLVIDLLLPVASIGILHYEFERDGRNI